MGPRAHGSQQYIFTSSRILLTFWTVMLTSTDLRNDMTDMTLRRGRDHQRSLSLLYYIHIQVDAPCPYLLQTSMVLWLMTCNIVISSKSVGQTRRNHLPSPTQLSVLQSNIRLHSWPTLIVIPGSPSILLDPVVGIVVKLTALNIIPVFHLIIVLDPVGDLV